MVSLNDSTLLNLKPAHIKDLESSGLTKEQMALVGHFSVKKQQAQDLIGYDLAGLIFVYSDLDGKPYLRSDGKPFYRIKPDWEEDAKTQKNPKYLSPKGQGNRPYFSRAVNWNLIAKRPEVDLFEVEGEKKSDCLCFHDQPTIGFSGVFGWVDKTPRLGEQKLENSRSLPELDVIKWRNRKVYQCYDSDIIEKLPVQDALFQRALDLHSKGAHHYIILLPNETDGSKNGPDDFVVRHGIEALRVLTKVTQHSIIWKGKSKEKQSVLNLFEPSSHRKALMAWSVLKETWAFRPSVGWYEWQRTYWKLRTQEEFEQILTQFMDAQNWIERSSGLITSVVRELRSRLLVRDKEWSPVDKLVFLNGTLCIASGQFNQAHNPLDRITKIRPYNFDPSAKCPIWLKLLNEATGGDRYVVELIQAWLRYSILPKPKDRKAEIEKSLDLFGPKRTGKGTVLEVLIQLVGLENIGPASPETFKSAVGLGQLIDKDLAVDTDSFGFLENIGAYNKVVSNEPVEVKKLYCDSYTTRLGVAVVRAYNTFIPVPDGSEGLDRRLTVIPFRHQPKIIDVELGEKLRTELPGIFTWAWSVSSAEMKRRILWAGSINAVAEASIERFESNNPEFRFLSEVFPYGREGIKAGDLYQSYNTWCRDNNHQPKSQVKFRPSIEVLGAKRSTGKSNGCYHYNIPKMVDFNVAAHLGIVGKQLEIVEDNCRDSSTPDPKQNRDSWGQLNTESFLEDTKQLSQSSKEEIFLEKSLGAQRSTTIPNLVSERDPTIVNLSPTVSTPSTPNPALVISHLPDTSIAEKTDAIASTPVIPSAVPTSKNSVQWFAPETLQDIAESLSRCNSVADLECLYQIWDCSSIKAACSLLIPETRTKIQEWIVDLEAPDQIELINWQAQ